MLRLWKSLRTRLASEDSRPERPPLRILRLERRRMLSADFALSASGLMLDGFDGARDLSISEVNGEYLFTLDEGQWRAADDNAAPADGVRVDGQTLAVDKLAVDPLADGVTVVAPSNAFQFNVSLNGVDFGDLSGALTLDGVTSINQPPSPAEFSIQAASFGAPAVAAAFVGPPTITINDMNMAGDLNLIVNGSIGDTPGAQIIVGGDLTIISRPLAGVAGIELANEAGDLLQVGGKATFEAQSADAADRFDIHVGEEGMATFGSLSVFGGKASVYEADATVLDDSNVNTLNVTSGGSITDTGSTGVEVSGAATFDAANDDAITLDDVYNFGTLTFDGGAVTIIEASGTELAGASSATSLDLDSAGMITDAPGDNAGTSLTVTGLADFTSTTGDAITLNDTYFFGSLRFNGGVVTIDEADGTQLSGVSLANSLDIDSNGAIIDDGTADVTVIGLASFNSTTDDAITLDDTYNFGALQFDGGVVQVVEASGTVISGPSNAATLSIASNGSITDDGTAMVNVVGLAMFDSTTDSAITLDDAYSFGQLRFDGGDVIIFEISSTELAGSSSASSLALTSATVITDAAGAQVLVTGHVFLNSKANDAITLDGPTVEFGSLRFDAGAVAISETDATVLSGVSEATSLALSSNGSITDDGTADLTVAGNASFDSTPDAEITLDDTYNFGTLTFDGGAVTIVEQSATVLAGASTAATLNLDSLGSITDTVGASLDVVGAADLTALVAEEITLDGAANTFGSVTFSGGAVTLIEAAGGSAAGTVIAGTSFAFSLMLTSDGPITDTGATVLTVLTNATFDSTPDAEITLGATYNFGTLTFDGGVVAILEQSGMVLTGANTASQLNLESATGTVTDTTLATLTVTGDARIAAAESIVLADAGVGNSLVIAGLGSFLAGAGHEIAIGVTPSTGDPADALATIGRLEFVVDGGNARVALDGDVTLDGSSLAADIELNAFGDDFNIVDKPGATLVFTKTAILRAANEDGDDTGDSIILGGEQMDGVRSFGMDADPTVFDTDEFLALEADNVSIVADTGINLRTGPEETPFAGSFFLRSAGTLAQVQGPATDFNEPVLSGLTPLTADRVALASDNGAVLFSQIVLTSGGATPNLSIEAGGSESFAAVIDGRVEFPTVDINGGADGEYLPIDLQLDVAPSEFMDDDPDALELLEGERIIEQDAIDEHENLVAGTPLGDAFSVVVVVFGDATVGVVTDATNTRGDQLGVMVSDETGNTFLRTLAGEGEEAEAGDLRFTSRDAAQEQVVRVQSGVFTAIADGLLTIETDSPDVAPEGLAMGEITTRLTSNTGTVTSVATFETVLGVPLELPSGFPIDPDADLITLQLVGPRFILDPPSNTIGAATTDQVRVGDSEDFVSGGQTVTFALGSRGEEGVLVEFEWADVNVRRDSPIDLLPIDLAPNGVFPGPVIIGPNGELLFDPLDDGRENPLTDTPGVVVEGTIPFAEITVTVAADVFDTLPASAEFTQTSNPNLEFRVVSVTHVYDEAFLASNPTITTLPTTVRVYNDPLINLYDQGGERSLNENANFLEPDIGQQPGFTEQQAPIEMSDFPIVEQPLIVAPVFVAPSAEADADLGSAVASDAEVILFGRSDGVDLDGDGFSDDIAGEQWPLTWQGDKDDFLDKIRTLVDEGAFSEGEYKIITKSPRGEQQLEVWIKGDSDGEQTLEQEEEASEDEATAVDEAVQAVVDEPTEPVTSAVVPDALQNEIYVVQGDAPSTPPTLAWSTDETTRSDSRSVAGGAMLGGAALAFTAQGRALQRDYKRSARRRRRLEKTLAASSGDPSSGNKPANKPNNRTEATG